MKWFWILSMMSFGGALLVGAEITVLTNNAEWGEYRGKINEVVLQANTNKAGGATSVLDIAANNTAITNLTSEITVVPGLVSIASDGSDTDFVFGSTQLADTANTNHDSRIWFDKSKAAFRAGKVTGDRWDDASVGLYSTGFGFESKSAGDYSFSAGHSATASGFGSVSIGFAPTASGIASFAAGQSTASAENSFSVGDALASGYRSAAFGNATAAGVSSTALGAFGSLASGDYSLSIGKGVASGDYSAAFAVSTASGDYSVAFGTGAASHSYSFAAGLGAQASGKYSAAFGKGAASGTSSFAAGDAAVASGTSSAAFGKGAAAGFYGFAAGETAAADSYASVALGRFNVGGGTASSWVAMDPLFEVGMGTSVASLSNAFVVYKNGNAAVAGILTVAGNPVADLHAMNKGYADSNYATPGGLTAVSNAFVAADSVVSNGVTTAFIAVDTVVSNALITADAVVSNALSSAYIAADTTASNGLTTAFIAADTVVSNALIAAIAGGGGGGGSSAVPVSPYGLEFAFTFDGVIENDWWGSVAGTNNSATQMFDVAQGGYLNVAESGSGAASFESPTVAFGTNHTIFIRFMPASSEPYASSLLIQETATPKYQLWTTSGFDIRFYYDSSSSDSAVSKGFWHTFAVVVSEAGMEAYMDGVLFASDSAILTPEDSLSLGNPAGGVTANMRFASFYGWNRSLSSNEVSRLHTLEATGQYGVQGLRRP